MKTLLRLLVFSVVAGVAGPALAQSSDPSSASTPPASVETRPATNTFLGDTGLWFVPTGEVLPAKKASGGAYYVNQDFGESFMDVADFSGVVGYGIKNKAEVFGVVPVLSPNRHRRAGRCRCSARRLAIRIPLDGWQTGVGDIYVGGKVNFLSQADLKPVAFAVRGVLKLPTASFDDGLGTGQPDFLVDAIVSKEINQKFEVSGYGGMAFRKSPDHFTRPTDCATGSVLRCRRAAHSG